MWPSHGLANVYVHAHIGWQLDRQACPPNCELFSLLYLGHGLTTFTSRLGLSTSLAVFLFAC